MAILVIFLENYEDIMDNLGLIDFKYISKFLYIQGKTNLKSISNNLAKMAINWQKIGQMTLWRMNIKFGITWSFFIQF